MFYTVGPVMKKKKVLLKITTDEEAAYQRRLNALLLLGDVAFGNIWWIHNDYWSSDSYWTSASPFKRPKRSSNIEHCGCSITPKEARLHITFQFLFGSSDNDYRTSPIGEDHGTYYGHFKEALKIPERDFLKGAFQLTNERGNKRIRHKECLNTEGQNQIRLFMRQYLCI